MTPRATQNRLTHWFRQWSSPLRKFLLVRGSVRTADVDDVAQEVFLRLMRYERAELIEHPQAYLFKMATNVAAEWSIRARNRRPHDAKWLVGLVADAQPDDDLAHRSAQQEIERGLATLLPRQREILRLHFGEGLSYGDIAARLSCTHRTIKRQLAKAYATLRAELDPELLDMVTHGRD